MCSVGLAVAFDCFPPLCWRSSRCDNSRTGCRDAESYLENLWHLNQVRVEWVCVDVLCVCVCLSSACGGLQIAFVVLPAV